DDCQNGYILDGVPRTIHQAEDLEKVGIFVDKALDIDVHDEVIEERMTGRRTCTSCSETFHVRYNPPKREGVCDFCGGKLGIRKDDQPETVKHRLEVYHRETEPLLRYYEERGKLVTVDGEGSLAETTAKILAALDME
ncbi:MAG: adenylate kinase family protein, partial [bacterium]